MSEWLKSSNIAKVVTDHWAKDLEASVRAYSDEFKLGPWKFAELKAPIVRDVLFRGEPAEIDLLEHVSRQAVAVELLQAAADRLRSSMIAVPDLGAAAVARRDNERNHNLHESLAVVAVAVLALAFSRRIAFEIGAGEVVKQHVEARIEQGFPAFLEGG